MRSDWPRRSSRTGRSHRCDGPDGPGRSSLTSRPHRALRPSGTRRPGDPDVCRLRVAGDGRKVRGLSSIFVLPVRSERDRLDVPVLVRVQRRQACRPRQGPRHGAPCQQQGRSDEREGSHGRQFRGRVKISTRRLRCQHGSVFALHSGASSPSAKVRTRPGSTPAFASASCTLFTRRSLSFLL